MWNQREISSVSCRILLISSTDCILSSVIRSGDARSRLNEHLSVLNTYYSRKHCREIRKKSLYQCYSYRNLIANNEIHERLINIYEVAINLTDISIPLFTLFEDSIAEHRVHKLKNYNEQDIRFSKSVSQSLHTQKLCKIYKITFIQISVCLYSTLDPSKSVYRIIPIKSPALLRVTASKK